MGRGEFSPFSAMCPRRSAGNQGVTKPENGSDLTLYEPPIFALNAAAAAFRKGGGHEMPDIHEICRF